MNDDPIDEFIPLQDIQTGETETIDGPPVPDVFVDRRGNLPFGWTFDDE